MNDSEKNLKHTNGLHLPSLHIKSFYANRIKAFLVPLNEIKNDRNANIMTFILMSHIFQFTNGTYKGKMTMVKDFDSY